MKQSGFFDVEERLARLREGLPDKNNTASTVWADTAYRSKRMSKVTQSAVNQIAKS
ncbi:hypothetical protein [Acetobacter thailandicus]|uniref:Transposase n=1 Tax=Acetobacter thailandicus TaxID=1502842 RepID=A0ABT3QHQ8_9PROT|nr:hypothetical protein [Acetobacter thailandicus]MCX2564785.1 hypothetical protein [Acetobacter thailandicus]NHN96282.1 hypothetical protein [Acetobacter thailandicus]